VSTATSVWRAADLARLGGTCPALATPIIRAEQVVRAVPGVDVWDVGPVWTPHGGVATIGDRELWLALSAPAQGDPGARHDIARLRLLACTPTGWEDLGLLFPNGASLGSREWAGSAVYHADGDVLDVLYTAVGGHDAGAPRFHQRIVGASARVDCADERPRLVGWSAHREVLAADGAIYERTEAPGGEPGFIKAFRDPFPFRDPADGSHWLLFTASTAEATSTFNGAVGLARPSDDGTYRLEQPLLHADGVNNELERPHMVVHGGRYYLFISTQRRTFAPGTTGPNGLYGFVAARFRGPYSPLNGSGLVLQNPDAEPAQAYSWTVLPDLRVASFVDFHSLGGRSPRDLAAAGVDVARQHFGGTVAPLWHLTLNGTEAAPVT
jgi:levansucrase